MFYSVDLLTLKRNGKFSKCWLAATMSQKLFLNKFRRNTIAAISISKTCGELMVYVTMDSSQNKFSLYLSTQLLFGATRILYYQCDALQKESMEHYNSEIAGKTTDLEDPRVRKKERQILPVLPIDGVVPSATLAIWTPNMVDNIDKITLHEDLPVATVMRDVDELNFGALTTAEVDYMLEHDRLCFDSVEDFGEFRVVPQINDEDELHTFKVPSQSMQRGRSVNGLIDSNNVPKEDHTLDKIPRLSVTGEDTALNGLLQPLDRSIRTPTKHKLPSPTAGTPSKRGRLVPEAESEDVALPVQIPFPILDELPLDQVVPDLSLDTIDWDTIPLRSVKKKPKRLIIDTDIELPQQDDVLVQRKFRKPLVRPVKIPAAVLLTTPCTQQAWGKTLRVQYDEMIVEPISESQQENSQIEPRAVLPRADEVRAPETFAGDNSSELSKDELKKTTGSVDISERTKTLEMVSIDEGAVQLKLPPLVEGLDDVAGLSGQVEAIPELPEDIQQLPLDVSHVPRITRHVIRDWGVNGQPSPRSSSSHPSIAEHSETRIDSESTAKGSEDTRFGLTWAKEEVLGILEMLWTTNLVCKFRDICSPNSSYTKKDAAQLFVLLLGLHKLRKVKLKQVQPYCDILIEKYVLDFY